MLFTYSVMKRLLKTLIYFAVFFTSAAYSADQCSLLITGKLYKSDKPYGKQIYQRELQDVENFFVNNETLGWDEKLEKMLNVDLRKSFFHLRILSQSYESLDAKFFSKKEAQFKNIEYLIGRAGLYRDLKVQLEQMDEPQIAEYFEKKRLRASKDLEKVFTAAGILKAPEKSIEDWKSEFSDYKAWPKTKQDRKFLLREMVKFLKDLNRSIEKNEYDNEDLELGLHRMRRHLREFIYRVVNLNGFIKLTNEGPLPTELRKWYFELKKENPNINVSAYLPSRDPEIDEPIDIPFQMQSILTEIVTDIGDIKDKDEPLFYIEQALQTQKFSRTTRNRVLEKIVVLRQGSIDQRQAADAYQNRLRQTRLLSAIVEFLKDQI